MVVVGQQFQGWGGTVLIGALGNSKGGPRGGEGVAAH